MNLVNELSAWETELTNLRAEVKLLRESKVITDFELEQLRRRNLELEDKVDYHLTRHVRLKTQLDRTGADLVQAIQAYAADDARENSIYEGNTQSSQQRAISNTNNTNNTDKPSIPSFDLNFKHSPNT